MFGPVSQRNPLLEAANGVQGGQILDAANAIRNSEIPGQVLGAVDAIQDRTGLGRNQYDRTFDAQRGLQSSSEMVKNQAAAAQADAQRQMGMAQEMGQFTRGLQRDSAEQQLYGDLAKGAQQAKAQEAANALNAYTQARANTGNFLASVMGTRF